MSWLGPFLVSTSTHRSLVWLDFSPFSGIKPRVEATGSFSLLQIQFFPPQVLPWTTLWSTWSRRRSKDWRLLYNNFTGH